MAVREYVGARYVPKFMGNWSPTTAYEPLCIVDDGLGTSYTSKKAVPAGTALTDPEYWAVSGSTSGAIIALQDRVTALENVFTTPQRYGAEGDGVTDDTQAFNDAMASGMNVYVPTGNYLITDKIEIPSDIIVFGSGTIIDGTGDNLAVYDHHKGGVFWIENRSNVTIDGLTFKGPGALSGNADHGCIIFAYNSANIDVRNCKFEDIAKGYAICYCTTDYGCIDNNYINGYTYTGIGLLNACNNIEIINNNLYDCKGQTALHTYPITGSAHDFTITGVVPDPHNIRIIGNYIENLFPWWEGIDMHGGRGVEIIGNTVRGCFSGIIAFSDANHYYTCEDITIADNVCIGAATGTIDDRTNCGIGLTNVNNATISGNVVKGFGKLVNDGNLERAISLAGVTNATVIGNVCEDNGTGISGASVIYISACVGLNISGNILKDNTVPMGLKLIGESNDINYHGNLQRNSGTSMANGASLSTTAPQLIRIHDNDADVKTNYSPSHYTPQFATNNASDMPNAVVSGQIGNIIYNSAPTSGKPILWVCVTAQTASDPAVYQALATMA